MKYNGHILKLNKSTRILHKKKRKALPRLFIQNDEVARQVIRTKETERYRNVKWYLT